MSGRINARCRWLSRPKKFSLWRLVDLVVAADKLLAEAWERRREQNLNGRGFVSAFFVGAAADEGRFATGLLPKCLGIGPKIGLANIVYNMKRMAWLTAQTAPA